MSRISVEGYETLGATHLYLVLTGDDGSEQVLRGGPELPPRQLFGDLVVTVGALAGSEGNRGGQTAADRHQVDLSIDADLVPAIWNSMVSYAQAIHIAGFGYDFVGANSNAVVGSALRHVGIDWNGAIPTGISAAGAVQRRKWTCS